MIYEYISDTGKVIEHAQSMHDPIPATMTKDGVVYHRYYRPMNVLYRASGFKATDTRDAVTKWQHEYLDTY